MKVLFLDIDGVCNSAETMKRQYERLGRGTMLGIDPYLAFLVGKIQLDTDCEVVLSSAWRLSPDGRKEVKAKVVNFIDYTKYINDGFRGEEVREWLERHPEVEKYAILDDGGDFFPEQNLFRTTWEKGLTPEIAKAVTDFLNA